MNKKNIFVCLFTTMLLFSAGTASAITMTVSYSGTPDVYFSLSGSTKTSSGATEFSVQLDYDEDDTWDLFSIGYCVDLYETIGAGSYDVVLHPVTTSSGNYLNAAWLMDQWADEASKNDEKEAGLQLAIWKAVYGDAFTSTTTGTIDGYYDTYIAALSGLNSSSIWNYSYSIVTFPPGTSTNYSETGSQELLIRTGDPVPEPATMVLFGIGLLGLGIIGRRRKK